MSKKALEIIELDTDKLLELLNKALADEWLAYYQYWIGSKVAEGKMVHAVSTELAEHANEELKHAEMLANRIIQLSGIPLLSPESWYKYSNCGYDAPDDLSTHSILKQNIKGEQCAIEIYNDLLKFTHGKDHITYQIILDILKDEEEHEEDLQNLLEDIEGI